MRVNNIQNQSANDKCFVGGIKMPNAKASPSQAES